MIPEETRVFDPELLMTDVIQYTHYMPDEWKSQLHSKKVCCLTQLSRIDVDIHCDRSTRNSASYSR